MDQILIALIIFIIFTEVIIYFSHSFSKNKWRKIYDQLTEKINSVSIANKREILLKISAIICTGPEIDVKKAVDMAEELIKEVDSRWYKINKQNSVYTVPKPHTPGK